MKPHVEKHEVNKIRLYIMLSESCNQLEKGAQVLFNASIKSNVKDIV